MRWVVWLMVGALWGCGGSHSGSDGGQAGNGDGGSGSGGADGGQSADCEGMVPSSLGSAFTFDVNTGTSASCSGASGDDGGTLAARAVVSGQSIPTWSERDSRGSPTGAFDAYAVAPQAQGFVALTETAPRRYLQYFDSGGGVGNPPVPPMEVESDAFLAPGWHGGAVVLSTSSSGLRVRRFAADLTETASATIPGSFTVRGGAEDASRAVLALVGSGSAVQGVWIDLSKGTSGAAIPLGSATSVFSRALVGGGIALRLDGRWTSVVLPTGVSPAPSWLSPDTEFAAIRGEKAYAVLHGTGSVDVVSQGGNLCGTVKFPATDISVGLDGTVVGGSGSNGCTKVFWPALLK
jgi:hypothetical protein